MHRSRSLPNHLDFPRHVHPIVSCMGFRWRFQFPLIISFCQTKRNGRSVSLSPNYICNRFLPTNRTSCKHSGMARIKIVGKTQERRRRRIAVTFHLKYCHRGQSPDPAILPNTYLQRYFLVSHKSLLVHYSHKGDLIVHQERFMRN